MTTNDPAPAEWLEWCITVPLGGEDLAAEALLRPPFTAVEIVGPGLLRTYGRLEFLPDAVRDALDAEARLLGATAVNWRPHVERDWEAEARASWRSFRVGCVCIGGDGRAPREGDTALRLEPGGAYGTGRHASTRGALLLMQRVLSTSDMVVDAGCGSGLLAVAALLLGARRAIGFDIDPNSPAASRALASRNGVADRFEFRAGGFEAVRDVTGVNGVVANLYYDLLERHAKDVARLLAPGGWFVFAGIRVGVAPAVKQATAAAGLEITHDWCRGPWRSFAGRRPR